MIGYPIKLFYNGSILLTCYQITSQKIDAKYEILLHARYNNKINKAFLLIVFYKLDFNRKSRVTRTFETPSFHFIQTKDSLFRSKLIHLQPMKGIPCMEFHRNSGSKPSGQTARNKYLCLSSGYSYIWNRQK